MSDGVGRVIAFAKRHGFRVSRSGSNHMKFTREGTPTVFFSSTTSDHRAWRNGITKIRRALREAETNTKKETYE